VAAAVVGQVTDGGLEVTGAARCEVPREAMSRAWREGLTQVL
jgi:hypothetical protein